MSKENQRDKKLYEDQTIKSKNFTGSDLKNHSFNNVVFENCN